MYAQKLSISLPQQLYDFIGSYQEKHHCKNRSEVINQALQLLQQKQLENYYKEANKETNNSFEITTFDGLDNETW